MTSAALSYTVPSIWLFKSHTLNKVTCHSRDVLIAARVRNKQANCSLLSCILTSTYVCVDVYNNALSQVVQNRGYMSVTQL